MRHPDFVGFQNSNHTAGTLLDQVLSQRSPGPTNNGAGTGHCTQELLTVLQQNK